MHPALTAALADLRDVFARYPRQALLEGCPHCRGRVAVDEHDLFSFSISLGNTVGDRDDVKSLLPLLFERMVTSTELDPSIVLATLPREHWRSWPSAEQNAIDAYLDTVWRLLLADHPSRLGSFFHAVVFLDAALAGGADIERFLDTWDATTGSAADRHLAATVVELAYPARRSSVLDTWLRRESIHERLLRAFERDHDRAWADDLARAYDLVRP